MLRRHLKIIIPVLIILVLSLNASAANYVDTHGVTLGTTDVDNRFSGVAFNVSITAYINTLTKNSGNDATTCFIKVNTTATICSQTWGGATDENFVTIANSTYSGNDCSFPSQVQLVPNNCYVIGNLGQTQSKIATTGNPKIGSSGLTSFMCRAGNPTRDNVTYQCYGGFGNIEAIAWSDTNSTIVPDLSPKIEFINQSPTNITAITAFTTSPTISYNYTQITGWTTQRLNISLYHNTGATCISYTNGSCALLNNTIVQLSPTTLTNYTGSLNYSIATYTLSENNIYPINANLNYTFFTGTHTAYSETLTNRAIKIELQNHTTEPIQILEIMANTSGEYRVYICNSSYTTGVYTSSASCQELALKNNTNFNHTHGSNSQHTLITYSVIGGLINGNGISVTNTMQYIIRPVTNTLNVYYVPNNSRAGATQTTTSTGTAWTTQTYTPDLHLHSYSGDEYIRYLATGYNGTATTNSSATTELIDLFNIGPTNPIITNPLSSNVSSQYLNITWTLSVPQTSGASIRNYTIQLFNATDQFIKQLANVTNTTTSYYLDVYNENLTIDTYKIRVIATDNLAQSTSDTEEFYLLKNTYYNITYINAIDSSAVTNNGTITATNNNTLASENFSVINGQVAFNAIKSTSYLINNNIDGYALSNSTLIIDATNNTKKVNLTLYTNNSVTIYIYDENSGLPITNNISVTFTGSFEVTTSTITGTLYKDSLTDGTWSIRLSGTNYTQKQYTISVASRSTQTLNAYLSLNQEETIFTILDATSSAVIEGATITQSRLINSTFTLVSTRDSDITGRAQFSYTPDILYRFQVSASGYQTNQFDLDPILFSTYNVRLTKTTTQTPASTPQGQDISITFTPINFTINTTHTLYYTISSPLGALTSYNLSITGPSILNTNSGVNAYGETFTENFNIGITNISDRITLVYCYQTTTSYNICNRRVYTIEGANSNYSFLSTKERLKNTGGLLDKSIIGSIILLFMAAPVFLTLGSVAGALTIIFALGFLYLTGFFSLWLVIPSILIAFFFILRGEQR